MPLTYLEVESNLTGRHYRTVFYRKYNAFVSGYLREMLCGGKIKVDVSKMELQCIKQYSFNKKQTNGFAHPRNEFVILKQNENKYELLTVCTYIYVTYTRGHPCADPGSACGLTTSFIGVEQKQQVMIGTKQRNNPFLTILS